MRIGNILKTLSFFMIISLCFSACANKATVKNTEKQKVNNINSLLDESFGYIEDKKIYRVASPITTDEEAVKLLANFENLCSQKDGQLIGGAYFIDKEFIKILSNNKAGVCEINGEPFFMIHQAYKGTNIYYSVAIDEEIMKSYYVKKKKLDFQIEPPVKETTEQIVQERKEIQRREVAREQKTKLLFGQKNQKTMTFFDSCRFSGSEASCSKRCNDINVKNNGFKSLKEALSNNWEFVSKIEETEEMLDNNCTCTGSSVILKKQ